MSYVFAAAIGLSELPLREPLCSAAPLYHFLEKRNCGRFRSSVERSHAQLAQGHVNDTIATLRAA